MATPTLVQHVASGRSNIGVTAPTIKVVLPNPSLANNLLVLSIEYDSGLTIGTVTDDAPGGTNTWSVGPTRNDSGQIIASFYVLGAKAGTQNISIPFTGTSAVISVSTKASEFYNVQTSGAIDTSGSAASKSVSLTTTTDGCLLWQNANDTATLTPTITSASPGSGCELLSFSLSQGCAAVFKVAGTHGSDSVSFTSSDSDAWQSVAIAFKSASAGTAPASTGIRIVRACAEWFDTTTHLAIFPCYGNLIVGCWTAAIVSITSIADNKSNSWSTGNIKSGAGGASVAQIMYAANSTPGTDLKFTTFTYSTTTVNAESFLILFDITGANVLPHDQDANNSGNQSSASTTLTTDTITPTSSNGLVFDVVSWNASTVRSVNIGTYAGVALDSAANDGGGTNADRLAEDDGRALLYNADLSSQTFTYTKTNVAAGVWASVASSFKAAGGDTVTKTLQYQLK